MRVETIVTLVLYVTSFEAVTEARRRNNGRGKHYTSSTYLDSYQYPGLSENGQDESEFSGGSRRQYIRTAQVLQQASPIVF